MGASMSWKLGRPEDIQQSEAVPDELESFMPRQTLYRAQDQRPGFPAKTSNGSAAMFAFRPIPLHELNKHAPSHRGAVYAMISDKPFTDRDIVADPLNGFSPDYSLVDFSKDEKQWNAVYRAGLLDDTPVTFVMLWSYSRKIGLKCTGPHSKLHVGPFISTPVGESKISVSCDSCRTTIVVSVEGPALDPGLLIQEALRLKLGAICALTGARSIAGEVNESGAIEWTVVDPCAMAVPELLAICAPTLDLAGVHATTHQMFLEAGKIVLRPNKPDLVEAVLPLRRRRPRR